MKRVKDLEGCKNGEFFILQILHSNLSWVFWIEDNKLYRDLINVRGYILKGHLRHLPLKMIRLGRSFNYDISTDYFSDKTEQRFILYKCNKAEAEKWKLKVIERRI